MHARRFQARISLFNGSKWTTSSSICGATSIQSAGTLHCALYSADIAISTKTPVKNRIRISTGNCTDTGNDLTGHSIWTKTSTNELIIATKCDSQCEVRYLMISIDSESPSSVAQPSTRTRSVSASPLSTGCFISRSLQLFPRLALCCS